MVGNVGIKFYCEICDLKCRDKYNFNKHIETKTHKIKQNKTILEYNCECGKSYSLRLSLYNHKKVCKFFITILFYCLFDLSNYKFYRSIKFISPDLIFRSLISFPRLLII